MSGSFEDELGSLYSGVKQFSEVIAVEKGATIAKATVYNPGCEITWLLPFTPSSTGLGEILLTGLPSNINADTVRATLFEGDAIILEVVTESAVIPNGPDDYLVDDPEKELENLKKMLRAANDNKEGYTKQVRMLEDYIAMVEKLPLSCKHPKLFTELIGDGNVASFLETLENTQSVLFETHNKIFEIDQEIAEIKRRQEVIQLQSRSPKSSKTCYNLSIQIFAQSTSPVQIHVSYLDPRASWLPSYDVRSNPDTHTLDITYYGVVKQTTGYDWKNINMLLSTATPSTAGSPPKLEPAILNIQPPARLFYKKAESRSSRSSSLDMRAMEAKCEYEMDDDEDEEDGCGGGGAAPMEVMVSDVVDNVTSSTFGIPRLVNLDSEDKDHKVTIAIINLEATIKYKVYPKISLHTFLKASSRNTSKFPLLLGSAKIFHGNNYICETTLKQINPEEKFSVFLGVDDSIKIVSRDPKQFGQVNSSLFSKTYSTSVESITEINNTRLFPVDVDVNDQLPLSQKTAIKVKMIEPKSDSDAIKIDAKRGRVKWHLTIPALQHQTIKFAYEIEYPPGSLEAINTV